MIDGKVKPVTLAAYRRHWCWLLLWLADRGRVPCLASVTVPALLCCFEDIYEAGYAYATPNTIRSAVALACRRAVLPPPYPTDHPSVKAALLGYKRRAAHRSTRRLPIRKAMLPHLLATAKKICPAEWWPQVHAAYRLGYDLLLRSGEILPMLGGQVECRPIGVSVYVPVSKTDQLGRGIWLFSHDQVLCGLLQQLGADCLPQSPLFTVPALRRFLNQIIVYASSTGGWPPGKYSFHSLRHGHATDAFAATRNIEHVMHIGRWSTRAAARWYLHEIVC